MHCVRINRRVLPFSLHFFKVLYAVVHFLFFTQINGRQEILNHVVVPVVDLPVPDLLLCVVSNVLDVQSCASLEVSEADLVEFLCEGLLCLAVTHLGYVATDPLKLSALLLFICGVPWRGLSRIVKLLCLLLTGAAVLGLVLPILIILTIVAQLKPFYLTAP